MKIEKGKLYYDTANEKVFKQVMDTCDVGHHLISDKIAVHCPTKEDWEYVVSKGYELTTKWYGKYYYDLYYETYMYQSYDYHIITIDQFKEFYPPISKEEQKDIIVELYDVEKVEVFNPQPHYDNTKGSLYKVATERGWSVYTFDVVKRLERGGKKDPLKQEIQKSIDVLTIWLSELGDD